MQTLSREGIELAKFILIGTAHLESHYIENSLSSSPLGCDFVAYLLTRL